MKSIISSNIQAFLRLTVFSFGFKTSEVSEILGLQPLVAYESDEGPRRPKGRAGHSMWIYGVAFNGRSIDENLSTLLNHVIQRERFRELSIDAHLVFELELSGILNSCIIEISSKTVFKAAQAEVDLVIQSANLTAGLLKGRTVRGSVSRLVVLDQKPDMSVFSADLNLVRLRLNDRVGIQIPSGVHAAASLALHLRALRDQKVSFLGHLRQDTSQYLLILSCARWPCIRVALLNIYLIFAAQIGLPLLIALCPGHGTPRNRDLESILKVVTWEK